MRRVFMSILPLFFLSLSACRFLDFGGDDKKAFELRFFWDRAPAIGAEDPENKGYDKDGNKIPSPEVYATYYMPDICTGLNVVVQPTARITPVLGIELCEFKLPYVRWFSVQLQAGSQLADLYIGKRLTSIFEVTIGGFVGRDFETNDWAWGIGGSLLKF